MLKVKIPTFYTQFKYKIFLWILSGGLIFQGWMAAAATQVHQIRIEQIAPFFSPNSVTVFQGTTIRWVNGTNEIHTIISDECSRSSSCRLNSGVIKPYDSYDLSRLAPGRYTYHCGLHPFMRGTITILSQKRRSRSADI